MQSLVIIELSIFDEKNIFVVYFKLVLHYHDIVDETKTNTRTIFTPA